MNGNTTSGSELAAEDLVFSTGRIVSSFVVGNKVEQGDLSGLIHAVGSTLAGLAEGEDPVSTARQKPAVPISKSVTDEHIVCLEDGAKLQMLKRYLWARFKLTPEEYRRKWKLPFDYPMTAPNYSKRRSDFAKANGLGKTVRGT
jgi:predicted transcriptional regulator